MIVIKEKCKKLRATPSLGFRDSFLGEEEYVNWKGKPD